MDYDYIIVGAGIAGLYAYHKLASSAFGKGKKVLVLEASSKVGGRMGQDQFYGTTVSIGAGIGRKAKDKLLQKLLKHFNIPTHDFPIKKRWLTDMQESESRAIVKKLRDTYDPVVDADSTFREHGIKQLGLPLYNKFMKHYEYTDMEKADAYETLYHYGLEDNNNGWTGISIPWNLLLKKMTPAPGRIKYNCRVESIRRDVNGGWVISTSAAQYKTKNVVLAVTSNVVKQLLPLHKCIYKSVESQPFMRIYGKFNKENAATMAAALQGVSVIVNNQIKRIIPMSDDVYMIVYSDNANALYMEKHVTGNNPESREWLCRKLEQALSLERQSLTLTAIKKYYWEEGTHYYKPPINFDKWIQLAQNPEPGLYVVGEMVSRDQGWVEGALDSVEKVFSTHHRL